MIDEIKIPKAWLKRLLDLGKEIVLDDESEQICHLKGYIESAESFIDQVEVQK